MVRSRPTSLAEGVKPRVDATIAERRGVRRRSLGWIVCLLALCASSARAEERVRVALLPLVVHTSEGREYLQQGLADMLVARLARDERLAVVPVDDPAKATLEPEAAREAGAANGAEYVLYGSFTRFGEGASVELFCALVREEEREPRRMYVHAPNMGALMPLLDGIAQRAAYAMVGAPAEEPAVSTGPDAEPAPAPREVVPRRVEETDAAIGNRERRAPGLPSDTPDGDLR